jgi:hypothetical protein
MFRDQQQALSNIRHLAESGGSAEFYDLLIDRVEELSCGWGTAQLSGNERAQLTGSKHRLLNEIERLRGRLK